MSLEPRELAHFASIARRVVQLIDATTIAITDIRPSGTNLTLAQLRSLVNRFYGETPWCSGGEGRSDSGSWHQPKDV